MQNLGSPFGNGEGTREENMMKAYYFSGVHPSFRPANFPGWYSGDESKPKPLTPPKKKARVFNRPLETSADLSSWYAGESKPLSWEPRIFNRPLESTTGPWNFRVLISLV